MEKTENEIILYQPNETMKLDVRVQQETVWLTQQQIAQLFGVKQPAISKHLKNIFDSGELDENSVHSILEYTAADGKSYQTKFYNLDAILSVGYRVNSRNATLFRQWANKVLKEYLLRGYSVNQRLMLMEDRIDRRLSEHDHQLLQLTEKVDFFVRSSLQPTEGIFFDGQIFDAYAFVADLIRKAKKRIVVIDSYIDDSVLVQLSKRNPGVTVDIYDGKISQQLRQDVARHNAQYPGVTLHAYNKAHDRFLIIDEEVYHIGHSLKDLGKKLFAFSKMDVMTGTELLSKL
ncbi:DNA-binding protein [Bacteroides thetaiotaomicron]|uniref:DNA-binding protein n=1 Tax=Bacteroides thetaiotaomicron TaxID=818 RepID=A0A7J5JVM3_BACT4|nr:RhuM family protein [Bacteroides thetaiotaomicron]KAB4426067.1 DNA-binding protein [Bacteroides thetaiotaomicron]KAB4434079.1 DNA-binding protein [Bacteroides thetaiotaomicron]KAB4437643.1 DNA-binding protein [Bacteroides thetaiotaomicron]KAB4442220.1 DNA-binding protein [Bacteroides thetaiotaomicron]KAB4455515.1 DNA-binding protein [Bacteroides thetaiotaomicron]